MGSYLTTSLLTQFSVRKKELAAIKSKEVYNKSTLQQHFVDSDLDLFSIEETEDALVFKVRPELLELELIPFLTEFYKGLYPDDYEKDCTLLLENLTQKAAVEQWLNLAKDKRYYNFQLDKDGITVLSTGWDSITIYYQSIVLALDGKIIMESYGRQFSFFEKLIRKVYANHKLASLIKIDLSN